MPLTVDHHASALGRWLLARWHPLPASPLAGMVDGIWYFEGSLAHLRERHFPTGRAELIVHLGPRYRRVGADGVLRGAFASVCVAGLTTGPDVIEAPPGESAVLGIRLHPAGAWAVLGTPMLELTDRTVDLYDLAGGEAHRLFDRCAEAATPEERVGRAAAWIESRVRAGPEPDAAVHWMIRRIEQTGGRTPIARLVARTGWSATRMADAFRREVGVTPKPFARIVRVRRALDLLTRGETPLSRIALDVGFYDQAHFTNEFHALTGFAPTEYRNALRFPNSPSLAEG